MIYAGKELPDVAFENPACAGIVLACFSEHCQQSVDRLVRAFINPAGKRISDKCPVKEWIQDSIYRMMQKPIANRGFADIPRLGIGNLKLVISAVPISLVG